MKEASQTMYAVYNLLAMPAMTVYLASRLASGKSREGWTERWGRLPERLLAKHGTRVWFHAASVGEVVAAQPILKEYRSLRPDDEILLSVITPGGHEVAAAMVGSLVDHVFYCPFDAPWTTARVVRQIQPDVFAGLETELWPNLLHAVRRGGAKMALLNARISDRSLPAYLFLRSIFRWVVGQFDRILAQSPRDAERFGAIGADRGLIDVYGNAKFDQLTERLQPESIATLRAELRLPAESPVIVIGSTRTAEEERQVFEACVLARKAVPNLVVIHAPRHIERASEVSEIMRSFGFDPVRRTDVGRALAPVRELILDTFGELAGVYALADVAYVGNSLTAPGGGQNLLQPLAQGKPVLYGRYMQNFRDLCSLAEEAGVGFAVDDGQALADQIVRLLGDDSTREEIGRRAVALIDSNQGAARRYACAVAEMAADRIAG